jgi:hypothetical protein
MGCVIPKARAFTSGPRDLPRNYSVEGDPSLRLKNCSTRDDAITQEINLTHYHN